MRICRISSHPGDLGGVQTYVRELSIELAKRGVDQYFVCSRRKLQRDNRNLPFRIYEHSHTLTSQNAFLTLPLLWKLSCKVTLENDIDIIHAHHGFCDGLCGAIAKKLTKKPLVITLHGAGVSYTGRRKPAEHVVKRILRSADAIIAVSEHLKNKALHLNPNLDIQIIPGGVRANPFLSKREEIRKEYNFFDDEKIIVFVGRVEEKKGIMDLIDAMQLLDGDLRAKLIIVGDGDLRPQLERKIKSKGVTKSVIFMGWREHREINKILAASDMFVLPSHTEGLPQTILEAEASGLPIIVTSVGGIPEAIEGYTNGILVNPREPSELAKAMTCMIERKTDKLNNHSLQITLKKYSWEDVADRYIKIYRNMI